MKKIILISFIMLFAGSAIFAQQAQPVRPAQEKTKPVKEVAHAKMHTAKTGAPQKQATAVKESSATATPLPNKDTGKRYKKHGRHAKKDGSTDKSSPQ